MCGFEGSKLETVVVPEDCRSTMNADWHRASVQYAMQNVAAVTKTSDVIAALGGT